MTICVIVFPFSKILFPHYVYTNDKSKMTSYIQIKNEYNIKEKADEHMLQFREDHLKCQRNGRKKQKNSISQLNL